MIDLKEKIILEKMFGCLFFNQKSKASRAELQKLGKSDRLLSAIFARQIKLSAKKGENGEQNRGLE